MSFKSAFKILKTISIRPTWSGDVSGDRCKEIAEFYNENMKDRNDFIPINITRSTAAIREQIANRIGSDLVENHPIWAADLSCIRDTKILLNKSGSNSNRYVHGTETPIPEQVSEPEQYHEPETVVEKVKSVNQISFDDYLQNEIINMNDGLLSPPTAHGVLSEAELQALEQGALTPTNENNLMNDYFDTCLKRIEETNERVSRKYRTLDLKIDGALEEIRQGLDDKNEQIKKVTAAQAKVNQKISSGLNIQTDTVDKLSKQIEELNVPELKLACTKITNLNNKVNKANMDYQALNDRVDKLEARHTTASRHVNIFNAKNAAQDKKIEEIEADYRDKFDQLNNRFAGLHDKENTRQEVSNYFKEYLKKYGEKIDYINGVKVRQFEESVSQVDTNFPRIKCGDSKHCLGAKELEKFLDEKKENIKKELKDLIPPKEKVNRKGDVHKFQGKDPKRAYFDYLREGNRIRGHIANDKRAGLMDIRVLEDMTTDDGPDVEGIKQLLDHDFDVISSTRAANGKAFNMVIQLKSDRPNQNFYSKVADLVDNRTQRKYSGKLGIQMHVAREFRCDGHLSFLRTLGVVYSWNITKKGALCVFIDDGDAEKRAAAADRNLPERAREYESTCTRIFPDVPELLETVIDPTVDSLRKLTRSHVPKHYIYDGEIVEVPEVSTKRQ